MLEFFFSFPLDVVTYSSEVTEVSQVNFIFDVLEDTVSPFEVPPEDPSPSKFHKLYTAHISKQSTLHRPSKFSEKFIQSFTSDVFGQYQPATW